MSWNAKRFAEPQSIEDIRKFGNPEKMTRHHAPPRHPDVTPKIIKVNEYSHRAYHHLFGNARSLEDCIKILERDWWKHESSATKPTEIRRSQTA